MEDDYVEGEDDEDFYGGGKAALTHRFGNNGGIPSPTAPPKLPLGEATSLSSSSQERELLPTTVEGGVDTNTTETSHLYSSTPRRKGGGNSARARYGNVADERRPPNFYNSGHRRSIRRENNNNENPGGGRNIFSRFFRFLFGFGGGNNGMNDNYYRNQRLPILATPFTNPTGPAGNYYGKALVKEV
nr:unnamed protein product [Meloidogyne enterolobii]